MLSMRAIPGGDVRARLSVRVQRAEGVEAADSCGTSDPYCEVCVWCRDNRSCEHMWRTATKLKTLDPTWDESAELPLTDARSALLHCLVFDWDNFGRDDFLGEAIVDVGQYDDDTPHAIRLDLADLHSKQQKPGHLYLTLHLTPEAPPSAGRARVADGGHSARAKSSPPRSSPKAASPGKGPGGAGGGRWSGAGSDAAGSRWSGYSR